MLKAGWNERVRKREVWFALFRDTVIAVLVTAAGLLTWKEMQEPVQLPPAETVSAKENERSAREAAYVSDLEQLKNLVQTADKSTAEQAARRMEQMIGAHQTELAVEEALHRAGYPSAFAVMHNGSLTVIAEQTALTAEASAVILALCTAHADVGADQIRIMPYEI